MKEVKKTLQPGFVLCGKKNYTVVSVLGQGGYGITYLAQHTRQGYNIPDKYAIKEFFMNSCCHRNPDGSVTMEDTGAKSARDYRKSFKLEAEHLMEFNQYAGMVHVQEIFETNGTVYYVMEHLGEKSLSSLLDSSAGKIGEDLAMRLTESVGTSLSLLHQKKMNHLDVKPDNIMLVGEASQVQPVLIDFGLSRHYNHLGKVTDDNAAFGVSDGYSPAEQYVGLDSFSTTADVYALAATLFHMLTGHAPERATKITESYLRDELHGKTSVSRINAIVKAMKMNAAERTQSVDEFLEDLELVRADAAGTGGTVEISVVNRKKKIMKALAGAAAVVLAGTVFFLVRMIAPTPKPDIHPEEPVVTPVPAAVPSTPTPAAVPVDPYPTPAASPAAQPQSQSPAAPQKGPIDLGYAIWNGEIRNGKPHGLGTMTYKVDRRVDSRDVAETHAAAGDKMKGEYSNGHWEYGTLYSHTGAVKAKISIGSE